MLIPLKDTAAPDKIKLRSISTTRCQNSTRHPLSSLFTYITSSNQMETMLEALLHIEFAAEREQSFVSIHSFETDRDLLDSFVGTDISVVPAASPSSFPLVGRSIWT